MTTTKRRVIGESVERAVNVSLLTGAATYIADVHCEGEVFARVVRSQTARGRILGIDVADASAAPGVLAVITAEDVPDVRIPIRLPMAETPDAVRLLQPPLARGVVRYVGEPIAVVVAEDPYLAEDAAELVDVEVEDLEPAVTIQDALADGAPLVDADFGATPSAPSPSATATWTPPSRVPTWWSVIGLPSPARPRCRWRPGD